MLNLHRVLICTGIDLDDIMQIDCLAYKYFVFYHFSLVGYNIWYLKGLTSWLSFMVSTVSLSLSHL